jgi:putative peptidoglycan lipid II flippase
MLGRLLSVSGFTALSRLAGFLRDVLQAAILGSGALSDAFMVAFRLPNHFRAIFAEGAFNAAFVPRFAALVDKNRKPTEEGRRFANEVFAWQLAAQMTLLAVALAAMPWVITILAPGFNDDPEQRALAITLTRITFPYLICIVVVTQLSDMLNAVQRFKAAAAAPILLNLSMIGAYLSAPWFPSAAHAAAWGVLAAGLLELLFLLWATRRAGLALKFGLPRWTPRIREFMKALAAAIVGAGSVQIGLFVDTIIASFLPEGQLTALYYADRINQLPMGIIGVALGTVLLPDMAARIAADDERGASMAQNRAVVLGMLLTLPCLAAFLIMPETIMRALFARGNFRVEAADISATVLMAYGLGLPAFVLMRCVVPSFYARKDTVTPVWATLASVAANIALKLILVWGFSFGVVGLALGTSFGAWVNLAVLVVMARRRRFLVVTSELRRALIPVAAVVAAAAIGIYAGIVVVPSFVAGGALLEESRFLLAGLLGVAFYASALSVVRRDLPLGKLSQPRRKKKK